MPTENRYLTLHKEEMARDGFQMVNKRKRFNTGHSEENTCETRNLFIQSSTEEKLNIMFEEILCIRGTQEETNNGMLNFQNGVRFMTEKMVQIVDVSNRNTSTLKTLAYKSIDIEARSRRNNLLFWGFVENYNENCFGIIRDFITQRLDLNADTMYLARAHRLGPRRRDQNQRRPIIVNFRDFCDVQTVMTRAYMLKNTPFSIDYDFPREITEARKRLWAELKTIKSQNPRVKYQIVYPAKLIVDGKLIKDEFPDWNETINASRLADFSHIDNNMYVSQSNIENMCGAEQLVMPNQNTNGSLRATQMCANMLNTKDKLINESTESRDQSMDEDSHSTTSSISYSTQEIAAGPSQQNVNSFTVEDTECGTNSQNILHPLPNNEYKDKHSNTELTDKQNTTESSLSQSSISSVPLTANKGSSASQCENANAQPLFRPFNVNAPEKECSNPETLTVNMQDKCLPDISSCETHSPRGHVSRSTQRGGARRACSLSVTRSDDTFKAGNQATKNPDSDINRQIGSKNRKPARKADINKQVTRESGNSQGSKNRSTPNNTDTNKQGDGQGP